MSEENIHAHANYTSMSHWATNTLQSRRSVQSTVDVFSHRQMADMEQAMFEQAFQMQAIMSSMQEMQESAMLKVSRHKTY